MQKTERAAGEIIFRCKEEWDKCQLSQWCRKITALNKLAGQQGGLKKVAKTATVDYLKEEAQADYREDNDPETGEGDWYDDCAKKDAAKDGQNVQPDHIHEVQLGGDVDGPFKWLDASVNGSVGATINNTKTKKRERIHKFTRVCDRVCPPKGT
jgi:hypothetical protein